jgi:hypothetical protein
MEIIICLLATFLWVAYAYLDGLIEAHYYDALVWSNRNHKDIHWMSFFQRGIILVIIGIITSSFSIPWSLALMFSYIHNGFYYKERNKLDNRIYPEKFKAESTTSTSFFEFNYKDRLKMFVVGLMLIVFNILIRLA